MNDKVFIYAVNASLAPEGETSWRRNITCHIATTDFNRAVQLFMDEHPDANISQVVKRERVFGGVIIDPLCAEGGPPLM